MAYATVEEVMARMTKDLSEKEQTICAALLDDVALLIDNMNEEATADAKKVVSCRVVSRTMSSGGDNIPVGASEGSMSGLGYAQSWRIGNSGAVGELYLTKVEKQMLGAGNKIGSHSPIEDFCVEVGS